MKKVFKNISNNKYFIVLLMMIILFYISNSYLIFSIYKLNNIENILRYLGIFVLVLIGILATTKFIKVIYNKFKLKSVILSVILVILFVIECIVYNTISKVYSSIDNISSNNIKYSSSLIALKDTNIDKLSELKNKKIGLYNNKDSIDAYIIPNEIIKEKKIDKNNKIIKYDDIAEMLTALYSKEVDAIFITSNYPILFSFNGFSNIKNETIVITTKEKIIKEKENNKQEITKPFTILLMGVDSTLDDIKSGSAFNGDALMLISFNPKTLNATMLSIPRDTYVPITCFKNSKENKITHAAWYGEECMINTIENFTKINIDYYAKINFKGLVKLVDTLGGIYVDVPYSLCEQDSNRNWGDKTVYVEKGYRKLNGEQALALSRNRHKAYDGEDAGKEMAIYCPKYIEGKRDDIERGQNQQKVINGILNSMKNIKGLNELYSLLDLMSSSVETNMSTNQILSLYNVAKKAFLNNKNTSISFDSMHLIGQGVEIWDDAFKKPLWNYYYNRQSLNDIVKAMNINLEKVEPNIIKEMNFSINDIYIKPIIGEGPYKSEGVIKTVPNFINKDVSTAINWGNNNNINVITNYVEVNKESDNNMVLKQSIPYGFIVNNIKDSLTITVGKYIAKNLEEDLSLIPDFSKYTIIMANNWKNKVSNKITVSINEIKKNDTMYDENNSGKLYKQSVQSGTNIETIDEINITYYEI